MCVCASACAFVCAFVRMSVCMSLRMVMSACACVCAIVCSCVRPSASLCACGVRCSHCRVERAASSIVVVVVADSRFSLDRQSGRPTDRPKECEQRIQNSRTQTLAKRTLAQTNAHSEREPMRALASATVAKTLALFEAG